MGPLSQSAMAGLLVSVRSVAEASAALAGGATLIDIKEPGRGPLGAADPAVWQAIRRVVPHDVPVSVALGELVDWLGRPALGPEPFAGISYRKIGLSGTLDQCSNRWPHAVENLRQSFGPGPAWVLVAYADWLEARAPHPAAVLDAAIATGCVGVLMDTWKKGQPARPGPQWRPWIDRARDHGLLVALAGGLDRQAIARLAPLEPDWFAVRGAACRGGDRNNDIDSNRVAELALVVSTQGASSRSAPSRFTRISSHSLPVPSDTHSRGAVSGFTVR